MANDISIRILAGEALIRATPPSVGLSIVHQTNDLRIEAAGPITTARVGAASQTILLGRALGRRGSDGILSSSAPLDSVDAGSHAGWARAHEGRYLLLHVAADGSARITGDRFGKIDLFIAQQGGGVAIATDLSLLPQSPATSGFDQAALAHTLTYYGHRPPKRHTIYKGVSRMGVGETIVVANGKHTIEQTPFQPVRSADYGPADNDRYADLFLDFLKASGSSEGNVVYLSSGWDSTSILAGLVHLFGASKVRAVIGRMHYSARSGNCNRFEIERAQRMADYYGIKLSFAEFDYDRSGTGPIERAQQIFKKHQYFSLTGLNHLRLAETTAADARPGEAVFAGEISDGAHNLGFSQYATVFHPSYEFREYADKMNSYLFGPTFLKEIIAGRHEQDAVWQFFRQRAGDTRFDAPAADPSARTTGLLVDFFLRNGRRPFWSIANSPMLTADGAHNYTNTMSAAYLAPAAGIAPEQLYASYLHLYNSFHWQGSTVATLQTMAEAHGLEAHLPFWSGGLQDFLSAMPESWGRGLDFNPTKHPLKWMLRNRVKYPYDYQAGPHSYTYDVDPSFNHGEELMCHSSITPFAQALLAKRGYRDVLSGDTFDLGYIDGIVDDYVAGRGPKGGKLSDLISVYLLCQTGWYA